MYVGVPTVSYVGIKLIQPMKSPELRATLLQRQFAQISEFEQTR